MKQLLQNSPHFLLRSWSYNLFYWNELNLTRTQKATAIHYPTRFSNRKNHRAEKRNENLHIIRWKNSSKFSAFLGIKFQRSNSSYSRRGNWKRTCPYDENENATPRTNPHNAPPRSILILRSYALRGDLGDLARTILSRSSHGVSI